MHLYSHPRLFISPLGLTLNAGSVGIFEVWIRCDSSQDEGWWSPASETRFGPLSTETRGGSVCRLGAASACHQTPSNKLQRHSRDPEQQNNRGQRGNDTFYSERWRSFLLRERERDGGGEGRWGRRVTQKLARQARTPILQPARHHRVLD